MIYKSAAFVPSTPIAHPRVGFQKHAATVTATSSAAGSNPQWLMDGETWSVWTAGGSSVTVTLTFASGQVVDYLGIAAHTLDLAGSTITLEANTGSGFVAVAGLQSLPITTDSAIMMMFGPLVATALRVVITGSSAPSIAVMQAGQMLTFPRLSQFTGLPIAESEQTTYRLAQSVTGNVLGRAVEAAELAFSVSINYLSEEFRTETGAASWQAFTKHVRDVGPFFIAGRPSDNYRDEVAYVQARQRPRFERATPNREISGSVTLECVGYKRP